MKQLTLPAKYKDLANLYILPLLFSRRKELVAWLDGMNKSKNYLGMLRWLHILQQTIRPLVPRIRKSWSGCK